MNFVRLGMVALCFGLSGCCERYDPNEVLDCEGQDFMSRTDYYQCFQAREVFYIRAAIEQMNDRSFD